MLPSPTDIRDYDSKAGVVHRNQNFQDPRGTNLQDGNAVGGSMVQDHLKTSEDNGE